MFCRLSIFFFPILFFLPPLQHVSRDDVVTSHRYTILLFTAELGTSPLGSFHLPVAKLPLSTNKSRAIPMPSHARLILLPSTSCQCMAISAVGIRSIDAMRRSSTSNDQRWRCIEGKRVRAEGREKS
jgi:hypothetical protein